MHRSLLLDQIPMRPSKSHSIKMGPARKRQPMPQRLHCRYSMKGIDYLIII